MNNGRKGIKGRLLLADRAKQMHKLYSKMCLMPGIRPSIPSKAREPLLRLSAKLKTKMSSLSFNTLEYAKNISEK